MKNIISLNNIHCHNWLKFELIEFCKKNQLSTYGSKAELKKSIIAFLNKQIKNETTNICTLINNRRIIKKAT